ncbi:hypothetical protein WJX81_005327 [Elliptochloris bilobata]|uniref:GPI-anchor transamidase n=1 Tax=Elliptochloris bilobata TaxID=381761 RepID=A0AAW1R326_9CHLO
MALHRDIDLQPALLPIPVDYRGEQVNVESFLSVLTGAPVALTMSQRPAAQHDSNVLVYLTGHGGNGFLKFQDREELTAGQLAGAVATMRFRRLLLAVDTCQAASLPAALATPGVVVMASSLVGEDSFSHHMDGDIGVPVIDRFTFHLARFLAGLAPRSNATLQQLADFMRHQALASTFYMRSDLLSERLEELRAPPIRRARMLLAQMPWAATTLRVIAICPRS